MFWCNWFFFVPVGNIFYAFKNIILLGRQGNWVMGFKEGEHVML